MYNIKHKNLYIISLVIQFLISGIFLYFFFRIIRDVEMLEHELDQETYASKRLINIFDSLEHEMNIEPEMDSLNLVDLSTRKYKINNQQTLHKIFIKKANDPLIKINSLADSSQTKPPEKLKSELGTSVPLIPNKIFLYEYKFNSPIVISVSQTITMVKAILLIKYNEQQKPKDFKSQVEIKQLDANTNKLQKIDFRVVKSQVNLDNTFLCVFQEYPLSAQNEFDAQNQRELSISITGSLDKLEANAILVWKEISGRPVNAKFKMRMSKND